MNFLIENWYVIVAVVIFVVFIGGLVYSFFKLPTSTQLSKVKEWLLLAVTQAESELGQGTGQLKLRFVYDLFITRFKWISRMISFETFSLLVDEALEEMRKMLETNKAVKQLVKKDI